MKQIGSKIIMMVLFQFIQTFRCQGSAPLINMHFSTKIIGPLLRRLLGSAPSFFIRRFVGYTPLVFLRRFVGSFYEDYWAPPLYFCYEDFWAPPPPFFTKICGLRPFIFFCYKANKSFRQGWSPDILVIKSYHRIT